MNKDKHEIKAELVELVTIAIKGVLVMESAGMIDEKDLPEVLNCIRRANADLHGWFDEFVIRDAETGAVVDPGKAPDK